MLAEALPIVEPALAAIPPRPEGGLRAEGCEPLGLPPKWLGLGKWK